MKLRLRLALTAIMVMVPMMLALVGIDRLAKHRAAEQILRGVAASYVQSTREACEASPETWGGHIRPLARPPHEAMPPPGDEPPFEPPESRGPPGPPAWREHRGPPGPPPPSPPSRGPGAGPSRGPMPDGRGDLFERPHARPAEAYAYGEDFRARNPSAPPLAPSLVEALHDQDFAVAPFAWRSNDVEVLQRTAWGVGPCAYVLGRGSTDPSWGAVLPRTELWLLPMAVVFAAVVFAMGPVVRRIRTLEGAVQRSAESGYATPVTIDGRDEIAELGHAFDAARREIRSHLDAKERRERALYDFIANTTHDVMIPLTVLQGHLTGLREHARDGSAPDPETVASAMNEAHYLGSLVHNLAVAARLDDTQRDLQRSDVDLESLVARVVGRHNPVARELGVALESAVPDDPLVVSADVTLLEQAVSNVTYNAIRYNHAGGHVALILERTSESGFGLRVIDDGPGMTAEELARVHERGARGEDARTRAPEGQGLGLHIALRAAEVHGFTLTLKPSEYGGLEVEIRGDGVVVDKSRRRPSRA